MKQISGFYAPIQNITKSFLISLVILFERIREDAEIKKWVEEVRMTKIESERNEIKKNRLFVITFSGRFSKRGKEYLEQHSGLICIDIDKLNRLEFIETRDALERLKPLLIGYFISPSGNGYKVIMRVNYKEFDQKENYMAGIEFLKSEIKIAPSHFDIVCKDVARACFVSHDPEAYLNKMAEEDECFETIPLLETSKWLNKSEPAEEEKLPFKDAFTPFSRNTKLDFDHKSDPSNFHILLSLTHQKKGAYEVGNRHTFIQALAAYANQFGITKQTLKVHCLEHFKDHPKTLINENIFDLNQELTPIIDDVYNRYNNQFETWIEKEIHEEMETPCLPDQLYHNLPKLIRDPISLFKEKRERDVLLLGMLGVLSTWMPKVQGNYDSKLVGANLFIVISAPASSGKGTLLWARKLCKEVIERLKVNFDIDLNGYEAELNEYEKIEDKSTSEKPQKPLKQKFIIAGNVSSAAMISCIQSNSSFGLIFETEADSLTNTLNNKDWGNFSDILRKSFHHEPVSLIRKKDNEDIEIEKPFLSMVLSGTPAQISKLVSSIENGFFSRILFYDFPNTSVWKNVFEKKETSYENYFDGYAVKLEQLLAPYFYGKTKDNADIVIFEFTNEQEELFNSWFADKQTQLSHIYGDDIIASVRRLAICFFRITMILSVLRHIEINNENPSVYLTSKNIICTDQDYKNAELIINTLLFHTIKIFNQVKGIKRNKYSKGKKDMLLDKLPEEFNRAKAMEIATYIGIKEKTAENYLAQFINKGWLNRIEHNHYKKN